MTTMAMPRTLIPTRQRIQTGTDTDGVAPGENTALPEYVTPEEYLRRERLAETKSEYEDGLILPMAGASHEHNSVAWNFSIQIGGFLRERRCKGYNSDQRVRVSPIRYYYPDISVVCGKPEIDEGECLLNPLLIVEVLSDSTEATDRGSKFTSYLEIPTLREYLLLAQKEVRAELYTRQADNSWRYNKYTNLKDVLYLNSLDKGIVLEDIYWDMVEDQDSEAGAG